MLILTRRPGEALLIYPADSINPDMTVGELFADGPLVIAISDQNRGRVRLGIDAPLELTILREELAGE